ncbi:TRAP-type mannitol/chloroaromatic compound transport system, small permease component [Malonomonas rubra DSM 5091]|uniref:TRAP-type mannitol/chloroaromatic compound transport system, small permease component n=1 Tax=Malonomonas rubra DSM 5091 TaxID=1122189 RepID=A0A1M6FDK0_MALRU|nr:TRAP transporter small permease subunit [Malonomonas rubra]SHI95751.1 TRAP-type mannitol/chloroaromatic compound transport system, small permease component [Malonomonas rubra DSM 5091]
MQPLATGINRLNSTTGRFISYLTVPLILVVVYEVFMRYAFNAPTVWAFEATTLMYGCHFVLGFAYTHQHNGHVAIDVFESKLPLKPRTILRIVVNLLFFIPTIGMLSYYAIRYAITSWQVLERASTSWAPPLYPFKSIMAIGFTLLFLQGVAKLIEDFKSLGSADE